MVLLVLISEMFIATLMLVIIVYYNRLISHKLANVPDPDDVGFIGHPLLGINIQHALSEHHPFQENITIMMIVSPSCHACHDELLDFLTISEERQTQLPFLGLVVEEEEGAAEMFIAKFGSRAALRLVEGNITTKLNIQGFPLAFVVDSEGTIIKVQMPMKRLVRSYLKMMRSESGT